MRGRTWSCSAPGCPEWPWSRRWRAAAPAAGQQAEPASSDRSWNITVAPYLWATAMDGNATVGGIKSDVDVPFSDILKDLSFGAMMLVDVEKGRSASASTACSRASRPTATWARSRSIPPATPCSSASLPTTAWSTGRIARRPRAGRYGFGVAPEAGFRFTYMRAELEVRRGRTFDQQRELGRPADRLAHRAGPHRPLRAHRRGQRRRLRGRLRLHVERSGLPRLQDQPVRPADDASRSAIARSYQDYHHRDFEWDVTMHGPVIGTAMRF